MNMQTVNSNASILSAFMSKQQLAIMTRNVKGEEGEFFVEKLAEMADRTNDMPKTYEQDGKGLDAIVHLHYFYANFDWYITEKDMDAEDGQIQAYGYADMGSAEMGYICIKELIENNVELDLHFTPRTLREIKQERGEL